jgi:hypothetical protein
VTILFSFRSHQVSVVFGLGNWGYHPHSHALKQHKILWSCHSPILYF